MASRKKQPTLSKTRQEIQEIYEQNELAALKASQNRGRSITIGTVSGGLIEVSIRAEHTTLYYILQPVEVVEIIEQLAAAAGLEVAKRPKQDFTSWRSWDLEQPDSTSWKGSAPWQLNMKDKKDLLKFEEKRFGALPAVTDLIEKPKLEATTRRKKKTQEPEETEE